jgi:predicted ATPase
MKQQWTLHVRDFGPIQSADIDIHPFMMFVGPNNSGKSYLNTLIWGLLTQGQMLFEDSTSENPAYKACDNWLRQEEKKAIEYAKKGGENDSVIYLSNIGEDETTLFIDWFNELLHMRKKEFLRALFNNDVIDAGQLSISAYSRSNPLSIKWKLNEQEIASGGMLFGKDEFALYLSQEQRTEPRPTTHLRYILLHMISSDISSIFSSMHGLGGRYFNFFGTQSIYLPSARTGFMLNFRSLASSTIGQGFSLQNSPKSLHTTPTISFLQGLIELPKEEKENQYGDIVNWLESSVINGSFIRQDDVLPNFNYIPKKSGQELALHVCSSLVTELAPLVLFLKASDKYGSLIIEEPEAHLHPAAQRKVAQALVRLVNRGLPVWVTTHSDIMFQQFNNLITLSHVPNQKETCKSMGYEESDILDPNDAMAYQFIVNEGGTTVEPLNRIETGFEAPSFNKTLGDLTAETIKLHDLTDDLESSES